ncbi:hypothetical protein [Herbaspirillum sp. meg3]|uniref:hypothetical protein n=1 Tax=Herbaspirillum sp. meg3 TaxID=2025949 RepID=UPI0012FE01EB|nr:hypothetical protein [Herbaspirillum sp. meg3]
MHGLFSFGIVIVAVILACSGWLVLMFLRAWDYWDLAENEDDMTGQCTELLEL